jgi:hypothetical protein
MCADGIMNNRGQMTGRGRSRASAEREGQRENYESIRISTTDLQNGVGEHRDEANLTSSIQESWHQDQPERTDQSYILRRTPAYEVPMHALALGLMTGVGRRGMVQENMNGISSQESTHQDQPERSRRHISSLFNLWMYEWSDDASDPRGSVKTNRGYIRIG